MNHNLIASLQQRQQLIQAVIKKIHYFTGLSESIGVLASGKLLRLNMLTQDLQAKNLSLAFVGEFSRGKSELINALFFSHYNSHFLPSKIGQTTMCPVEIQSAPSMQGAALKLLPISSRELNVPIEKLKKAPAAWHSFPLEVDNHKSITNVMQHLTETICVYVEEARKLGLCPPLNQVSKGRERTICPNCGLGKVLIPRWRYALLNLPQSSLIDGLNILDTPGLNALGSEPELTLDNLASADVLVFLLSIDTGISQSDLGIWQQYLEINTHQKKIIALNKIDLLWDNLLTEEEYQDQVLEQVVAVAERLGVDPLSVIPISAKQGLIAQINNHSELLEKSGLPQLELTIAEILSVAHIPLLKREIPLFLDDCISEQRFSLEGQMRTLNSQLERLEKLKSHAENGIPKMIAQHRATIERFIVDREKFNTEKEKFLLAVQTKVLNHLSLDSLIALINSVEKQMLSAWTTRGILLQFRDYYLNAAKHFDFAQEGAVLLSQELEEFYLNLKKYYQLPELGKISHAILPRRAEFMAMVENHERFGTTLEIAVNTQNAVVHKAFGLTASKTRELILAMRRDIEQWSLAVLEAIEMKLNEFDLAEKKELASLEKLQSSATTLEALIREAKEKQKNIRQSYELLDQARLNFEF